MGKSNWFWNAWIRRGVIVEVHNPNVVSVVWQKHGKMWKRMEQVSKLEILNGKLGDLIPMRRGNRDKGAVIL